ncbi:hypothetical protein [Chamaesiphon sp. OTE_75_metabat_556]|uniref:hypothetical protein n=1 Tax=Chamaesiphon sp. OTE_75_metabat_556 TaxID=2964692 RepID=UPI00286D09D6|nr:hypothetical protein [Chamaesiphon sp. OTE_75_metabat_556]
MAKDEIVKYLEDYAASFNPLIKAGVIVNKVSQKIAHLPSVLTSVSILAIEWQRCGRMARSHGLLQRPSRSNLKCMYRHLRSYK